MTAFAVWAPEARSVQLHADHSRLHMHPADRGWWRVDAPEAGPGTDYRFQLDRSEPLPDPRSPWQPHGVHGASRVVNHAAFTWTDQRWQAPPLSAGVLYELHVGTFTPEGTFDAAIPHLARLKDLGVTHVELMPVSEFPGDWGWGYDGVDLYAPHHSYGGPQGLKRLVDACHAAGLGALLDVVYNHLGPDGNYLPRFGPYFSDRHATPWGPAINLDGPGSTEVRRFLCDNAIQWLRDYHFDGLRVDAVHAIFDSSAVHFLEQLTGEVRQLEAQLGRRLEVTAESDLNDPRIVSAPEAGGYGVAAQWNDDYHHALHAVLTGERNGYYADFGSLADIAKSLKHAFVYDGCYSRFRRRNHGRRAVNVPGSRFIGFFQNHDQTGNRARGDRSAALLSVDRLKIAAAMVLCAPFIPLLFQGEEFGATTPFLYFTHHQDAGLARKVSEGRRREFAGFGWEAEDIPDPQDPATFSKSKLRLCNSGKSGQALLDWHRRLIALRRAEPDLSDGRMDRVEVEFSDSQRWLWFRRGSISVVCNLDAEARNIGLRSPAALVLCSSGEGSAAGACVSLPPDSIAVLKHFSREL